MSDEQGETSSESSSEFIAPDIDDFDIQQDWKSNALCHGLEYLFDIPEKGSYRELKGREQTTRRGEDRKERETRRKNAQSICFECPVFTECWLDAYADGNPDYGVIRAGASLGNWFKKIRIKKLEQSWVTYLERKEHYIGKSGKRTYRRTRGGRHTTRNQSSSVQQAG